MGPPLWVIIFSMLAVGALGIVVLGRGLGESMEARARTQRYVESEAQKAADEENLLMGTVRGIIDPLGIIV